MRKSTIKKIRDLDLSEKIILKEIMADKAMVQWHYDKMKATMKDKVTEQEIWRRINAIIIRDNIFNAAMEKLVNFYEFQIIEQDITEIATKLKELFPDRELEVLKDVAEKMLIKEMIFEDLSNLWNIKVTDDEVKAALDSYYKFTNESVKNYLEDQDKFENIRKTIFEEKMANEIISRIKYELDLPKPPQKEEKPVEQKPAEEVK